MNYSFSTHDCHVTVLSSIMTSFCIKVSVIINPLCYVMINVCFSLVVCMYTLGKTSPAANVGQRNLCARVSAVHARVRVCKYGRARVHVRMCVCIVYTRALSIPRSVHCTLGGLINPRRACAARVTVLVLHVSWGAIFSGGKKGRGKRSKWGGKFKCHEKEKGT